MNLERGLIGRRAAPVDIDGVAPPRARRRWVVIAVIAALAAAVAIWAMTRGGGEAPAAAPTLPRVTVVVPGRQSITATITATGTIASRREMPVGVAGEGGLVTRVLVDAGDWVRAGQVLATVDRSVQVQQTAQMRAQIASAQADARLAQLELDRARKLVGRGFISQATIDQRSAARDAATARVKLAQAQSGEMNARLGRLDIRSPSDGLVLARAVEPGQIVSSGSGALFRVARGGQMEMQARLAEDDLARLRVGAPATVTPVGSPRTFKGEVWQMAPVIDAVSRQGTVRIAVPYDPALRPGGFASATLSGGVGEAPLLPESAVLSDQSGNYVYIVAKDGRVARRPVTVGEVDDRGVTIVKGLTGQERVVGSAGAFLNPGDKVVAVVAAAAR